MQVDAREHPVVQAALARLAAHGGWARLRGGEPLQDRADRVDAELLAAAGVLRDEGEGRYALADDALALRADDPAGLAHDVVAGLRRALRHAEGVLGWVDDPATMLAQGRASAVVADLLHDRWLPGMPGSQRALADGPARFLDVGTGVAAISARLCALYPRLTAVGVDVSEVVLGIARDELAAAGLADRVALRHQSVADLEEVDAYDLAWLPQPFLAPDVLVAGLARVRAALRPDRWVVVPLAAPADDADPLTRALFAHSAHRTGGGPVTVAQGLRLLADAGYADADAVPLGQQVVLRARRP